MAKKKKDNFTTVCQDCLNSIPDKTILKHYVKGTFGIPHIIYLCKNCKAKRDKNGSSI
jgi:hypothetical protein